MAVVLIVGALTFFPALSARADRRALPDAAREGVLSHDAPRERDAPSGRRSSTASASWIRGSMLREPGHVRGRGGQRADDARAGCATCWPPVPAARRWPSPARSRSGCGSRCCSPTSPRPWPRAAARRRPRPARTAARDHGAAARRGGREETVPAAELRRGRPRRLRGGRHHPRRRRGDRGHRVRRRVGDHRRVGAGHPRERRRPLRRHRRHARALRPHRRPHHREPGRVVPRPHDRAWSRAPSARRRPTRSRCTILLSA